MRRWTRAGAALLGVLAVVLATLTPQPDARAAWTATGAGTASTAAVTLPAMGTVTATRGSLVNVLAVTFTVSWSAVPVSGGVVGLPVSGYWVERLTTAGVPDATAGGCNRVVVLTLTCTETLSLVSMSNYTYRVRAVLGNTTTGTVTDGVGAGLFTGPPSTSNLPA